LPGFEVDFRLELKKEWRSMPPFLSVETISIFKKNTFPFLIIRKNYTHHKDELKYLVLKRRQRSYLIVQHIGVKTTSNIINFLRLKQVFHWRKMSYSSQVDLYYRSLPRLNFPLFS